jgi:sugar transferase (PEP-CTERM/EpsH1 system associated)
MNPRPGVVSESKPAVLYLVHRLPYPPDKGDRIRAFHLLKFLGRHAAVHVACLADEPVSEETADSLRQYCDRLAIVPLGRTRWLHALSSVIRGHTISEGAFWSGRLAALLRDWTREMSYRVVLASASSMVPFMRLAALRDVPAVVDLVDVDSQKWLDYAAASRPPRRWLYRFEGRRLRALESDLPTWARAATLVSTGETDLFKGFCAWDGVHAITNGVDLDYFRPFAPAPAEEGCVFVGALDYRPNVDAACWFCQEVWPKIRQRVPQAQFRLVGRQPTPEVQRLAEVPGVEVVGQVPDVRPHVARSAVVVAPLRIARGVQNKVLEAMALGKAVVASPQALKGLGDRPDVPALSAATPAEWVEHLTRLLADEPYRRQLGAAGRRYVEEHHDWERCLEPFGALLGLSDWPKEQTGALQRPQCYTTRGS